eukprot:gb/GEZN01012989.1/.p1 GENE.gb/GEZN01012989.1/~~gb/GEZN01012989.1/.p1  ORF type:complete len:264 (+),score=20.10 gb/GEZN01012989.1/:141-932(+)
MSTKTWMIVGGVVVAAGFSYYWLTLRRAACAANHVAEGQSDLLLFNSHLGKVDVQVFGGKTGDIVIALHGVNSKPAVRFEWDTAALKLSQKGYRVLVPQLHSNPNTAPGIRSGISADNLARLLLDLLTACTIANTDAGRPVHGKPNGITCTLLGKSWGGRAAVTFAAMHPSIVNKLAVVCPAVSCSERSLVRALSMPVAVFWAKDDWITPIENVDIFTNAQLPSLFIRTARQGGHTILSEYLDPLVKFVEGAPTEGMDKQELD